MYPIILREDALTSGLSPQAINRYLQRGRWLRLHRGVYVEAGTDLTPQVRAAAAIASAGGAAVASHQTAARLHRIEIVTASLSASGAPEHVTVSQARRRRNRPGLITHIRGLPEHHRIVLDHIRATTAVRTIRYLLLDADRLTAVWAAENAVAYRYVDIEELTHMLDAATGRRGVRRARARLALVEPRSESPLETGVRLLAHDAGLPALEIQIPVLDGRYRIDLGYRRYRLGIECDGKSHDEVLALYADRARANTLDRLGWRLLRFTWRDLQSRPEYIVDTIRAALRRAA